MTESTGVVYSMPRAPLSVVIKPSVFFWLLDKSGWTIPEIANKIDYTEEEIREWRNKEENIVISVSKIETISKAIKRPLSAFFMPEPPKEPDPPKDFRKLTGTLQERATPYSKETQFAIWKSRRLQEVSKELLENLGRFPVKEIPRYTLSDDPEKTAKLVREASGISIDTQIKSPNASTMYEIWREWLIKQDIFIFQFELPVEDARGFTLIDSDPKIIVVNKNDALNGRIFSLFHEYAHILLRESVVCNFESDESMDKEIRRTENWCNSFAGAFLFPKDAAIDEFKRSSPIFDDLPKFLSKLSEKYRVSSLSILIRYRFLNFIEYPDYLKTKGIIESRIREKKTKEKEKRERDKSFGIEIKFSQESKDKTIWIDRGTNFVSLVVENSNRGFITERDVMDFLDLKIKHLEKLLPQ